MKETIHQSEKSSGSPFRSRGSNPLGVQTKKFVNKPGDKHEVEADQAADRVVNGSTPAGTTANGDPSSVQLKPIAQNVTPYIQRKESADQMGQMDIESTEDQTGAINYKGPEIQRKEENNSAADPLSDSTTLTPKDAAANTAPLNDQLTASKGQGVSLPVEVQTNMENHFGADFSKVKTHTGTPAQKMSRQLGAEAFTHQNDIYFNTNKFSPTTTLGKFLLAHELTHTIQQGASAPNKTKNQTLNPEKKDISSTEVTKTKAQIEENPGMEQKGKELTVEVINKTKEQQPVIASTSTKADEKSAEPHNDQKEAVSNVIKQDKNATANADKKEEEVTETGNVIGQEKVKALDNTIAQKEEEKTSTEKAPKKETSSLNEFKDSQSLIEPEQINASTQQQVSGSKVQQTEQIATEPNKNSQQNSIEPESNKKEQTGTETSLKTDTKEPVGASQLKEEMKDVPVDQVSQTPKEASTSLTEPEIDPLQKQDSKAQEVNEVNNEETEQSDVVQEDVVENVSVSAGEMAIQLDSLEKSHTESLSAYHRITQKNIGKLQQQSEKALQTCDDTYHQQVGLIESGYGNAIRKVKKALSTTLTDLSKGKSNSRKKLTGIIENKVKKAGYITWNKQQEAEAMGNEFAGKTWKYTNDLKEDSNNKASDQRKEIKDNGADAKGKYKNHKYRADVEEAVDESVRDYCESIYDATVDLKEALTEDAGGMAANFKSEATDLKALLPQGKQQTIQNIRAIARDGAKQFNKVDQDLLPTLRKQMHTAEEELHKARKQALTALKDAWIKSRQGIKEQQKQLELKLRNSEKQAVKENKQVMTEVRAEYSQDPEIGSQLGEMNALMKKSPGELAAAQQNLLKQGGVERQKGVQSARKGMTKLASDSVKQAQKMADTAEKGAAKLKAGALKGYGQVVSGTENAMDDELKRYERSLDKILGKARGDWNKKLSQGTWGMRKKAHEVWYENGKLRKESRKELFAVAKDASEVDFWDVLEAIGNFLLGVLIVIGLILVVLVVIWAIGALLASLGVWLVALTAEYAIGSLVAALVVGIEMLITGILSSTVFWVATSAYGIYSGYKTIKESKNNPNLTRNQAAREYGSGTAEIILSLLPFWGKLKGRTKGERPQNIGNELDNLNTAKSENINSAHRISGSENALNLENERLIINTAAEIGDGTRIPYSQLTARQKKLLKALNHPGDIHKLGKNEVSMNDLKQLTNHTGDEFNMFTLGSRRTIIRGQGNKIKVPNQEFLDELYAGKYGKFSGHTHPPGHLIDPGPADRPFLTKMRQERSGIWGNTVDEPYVFGQNGPIEDRIIQNEIRSQKMEKYYNNLGL